MESVRVFRGDETDQVLVSAMGTIMPADPAAWYWEPADYQGKILYSKGFASEEDAIFAAEYGNH